MFDSKACLEGVVAELWSVDSTQYNLIKDSHCWNQSNGLLWYRRDTSLFPHIPPFSSVGTQAINVLAQPEFEESTHFYLGTFGFVVSKNISICIQ